MNDTNTPVFRTLQEMNTNRTNYTYIQNGHMQLKRKPNKLWVRIQSVLLLTVSHAERSVTRWMFVWALKRAAGCRCWSQWRRLDLNSSCFSGRPERAGGHCVKRLRSQLELVVFSYSLYECYRWVHCILAFWMAVFYTLPDNRVWPNAPRWLARWLDCVVLAPKRAVDCWDRLQWRWLGRLKQNCFVGGSHITPTHGDCCLGVEACGEADVATGARSLGSWRRCGRWCCRWVAYFVA
jgi:hypothetical protein